MSGLRKLTATEIEKLHEAKVCTETGLLVIDPEAHARFMARLNRIERNAQEYKYPPVYGGGFCGIVGLP